MSLPHDYAERVYAGVLGKMIGVYLGRPFEQWSYERIMAELGEITYYVNDRLEYKPPVVITDDDLAGTFTFLRALPDYGHTLDLSPANIGQTWLNYIIEERTTLWWGGLGNSTEHTAYLRLKRGVPAPDSGSIGLNGKIIAEQIGAQIFVDGWAMVAPGDPELAADLARRAASVSHDGEAIYGAQVIAAMEAQAFVEADINKLIDCAVSFIPEESVIHRMIGEIREWHASEPDWRKARARIAAKYGYDSYGGNCHIVPNHALIILGLLYGDDDFQRSMLVVNTAGWDTDCNAGNLGCLLGIKNGLAGLEMGPDWRGPVADRLFLATADGGRAITDAAIEALHVINIGRALAGESPIQPKNGARFHFEFPGSVQGFRPEPQDGNGSITLGNVPGHSRHGERALALRLRGELGRAATPTFILPDELDMPGYMVVASPTLYSGQTVRAAVGADTDNDAPINVQLYIQTYDANDALTRTYGPQAVLPAARVTDLEWRIPDMHGAPVAQIGLELRATQATAGTVYLDYLTWAGAPDLVLSRPIETDTPWAGPLVWRRAWVNGIDQWEPWWPEAYRLAQNAGRGLLMQGTREWSDYEVCATITPTLMAAGGIGARVQGMRRYYALLLCAGGTVRLLKALDGDTVLSETAFAWESHQAYALRLRVKGTHLRAWVDEQLLFDVRDEKRPLLGGGVALACEEGHLTTDAVVVRPVGD